MAKKVKVPINKLESTMKSNVVTVPMKENAEIEITIRRVLPLQEVLQFVEDVVSSCIDAESGRYIPEIRAFTIRASVLTRYANFTLPKDLEKQYEIIYNTDAFDQVMEQINKTQYEEIVCSIDDRIEHEIALIESAAVSQITELTAKINAFVNGSEKIFSSIKGEDISVLVKNLSQVGRLDEEKLAKAVLEAKKQETNNTEKSLALSSDGKVITLRKKKD